MPQPRSAKRKAQLNREKCARYRHQNRQRELGQTHQDATLQNTTTNDSYFRQRLECQDTPEAPAAGSRSRPCYIANPPPPQMGFRSSTTNVPCDRSAEHPSPLQNWETQAIHHRPGYTPNSHRSTAHQHPWRFQPQPQFAPGSPLQWNHTGHLLRPPPPTYTGGMPRQANMIQWPNHGLGGSRYSPRWGTRSYNLPPGSAHLGYFPGTGMNSYVSIHGPPAVGLDLSTNSRDQASVAKARLESQTPEIKTINAQTPLSSSGRIQSKIVIENTPMMRNKNMTMRREPGTDVTGKMKNAKLEKHTALSATPNRTQGDNEKEPKERMPFNQTKLQESALARYFREQHEKGTKKHDATCGKDSENPVPKRLVRMEEESLNSTQEELSEILKNIESDLRDRPLIPLEIIANPGKQGTKRKRNKDTSSKNGRRTEPDKKRNLASKDAQVGKKRLSGSSARVSQKLSKSMAVRRAKQREYKKIRRKHSNYRALERARRQARIKTQGKAAPWRMKRLIAKFRECVSQGPSFVCMPCNRQLYKHSVRAIAPVLKMDSDAARLCTTKLKNQQSSDWICHTCFRYLKNKKVPPMSIANGLGFPSKPPKLQLHKLEWRLLAPRIVFMKIHQAPRGKQYKIEGNVVNVVSNVVNTVNALPRVRNNAETIPVKLKRRLKYNHHALSQNIRPNVVRNAARWLVKNGPLFKEEGIEYNENAFMALAKRNISDTSIDVEKILEATAGTALDSETSGVKRVLCNIGDCRGIFNTLDHAEAHIKNSHNGHVICSDNGHSSKYTTCCIIKQNESPGNQYYRFYCPICDEESCEKRHPKEHMFIEHGILDLDSSLSYHNSVGGLFRLHSYTLHSPTQVGLCILDDTENTPPEQWVVEMKTLNITQTHIELPSEEIRLAKVWDKGMLPDNPLYNRIMQSIYEAGEANGTSQGDGRVEYDSGSDWGSDEEATGATDTMLTDEGYVEAPEFQAIYNFAPAENQIPKSIFLDKYCEEMAYPDIFLGHSRPAETLVPVQYSDIVKSELLQVDRRAALNVENIFFKAKKLQMKLLTSRTQLALRQHKTSDMNITAGVLKNPDAIRNIILHDQGYQFLQTLRGSPPYFRKAKQDLFAMIRQLGPATFFISLSAAETRWDHLIRILGKSVDKRDYSDEDIATMPWEEKCRLVQSDPITSARHFDYMMHLFIAKFLKSPHAPLGKVLDHFYRVEMQHRGSCHVHMVVWIEGAPHMLTADIPTIIKFIDEYVTCREAPADSPYEIELVSRQKHSHTPTCKKNKNAPCRFHYPQPPFPQTVILDPLPSTDERYGEYKSMWSTIHNELEGMARGTDSTFQDFLDKLSLTIEEYTNCVRTSIQARTVFLKRSLQEITINNYNKNTMLAWQANMDIQYVLDAYACATYIISYMSKGSRGMSRLLARASDEARAANNSIPQSMRHIGNKFLNSVEISAQEAVYLTLQLSLRKSSRTTIFINTTPPHERVRLLKKQSDLDLLDDSDTNIDSSNLIQRYALRPANMEKICLAEWAAWHDLPSKGKKKTRQEVDVDGTPVQDLAPLYEENDEDYPLDNTPPVEGTLKKRRRARVIRCPWFDVKTKEDYHYRELIMLFVPWRDEAIDLTGGFGSCKEHYLSKKDEITEHIEIYSPGRAAVEEAMERHAQEEAERLENAAVAPSGQHADETDRAKISKVNDPTLRPEYDIGQDIGIQVIPGVSLSELQHNRQTDSQMRSKIQKLNLEQRTFFDFINHNVRTSDKQIFAFLSGGAGVGKSHLEGAIYQQLLKLYTTAAGDDPDTLRVLVMAPTGKAAHIVKGMTIHSALKLPYNNVGSQYIPLSMGVLNTVRSSLGGLKFIIIDEISMVGNNLFNYVDRRLQDIKGLRKPFGGCHILCIGDLYQLKPVCDPWIFLLPSKGIRRLAENTWQKHFQMYELKTIMRQRDHQPFAELLNRLREGKQTDDDVNYLKSKTIMDDITKENYLYKDVTHLYATNAAVENFNQAARTGIPVHILADDHLRGSCNEELTRIHMQKLKEKPAKDTQGLASDLIIAKNDRVEVTQNICIRDGLTNGAAGQVMLLPEKPDYTDNMVASGIVWVLFDEDDVGSEARAKGKRLYTERILQTWTPIEPQIKQLQVSRNTAITATRTQFPLRIAAAKTIHRCQGQTLHAVVTDFFAASNHHMHYVALSRVSNPDNLYIKNFNHKKISTDKLVHAEMKRLRNTAMIKIPTHLDYRLMGINSVACYINIRSLNKHADDLAADFNFKNSYLLLAVETNLITENGLAGMKETHPYCDHNKSKFCISSPGARLGISCFSTTGFDSISHQNTDTMECTVTTVTYPQTCTYICVYRYHRTNVGDFVRDLNNAIQDHKTDKLVIVGDMNLNTKKPETKKRIQEEILDVNNLIQLETGPTTKHGSQIDHIYTNIDSAVAHVIPTYYSDHDMIKIMAL